MPEEVIAYFPVCKQEQTLHHEVAWNKIKRNWGKWSGAWFIDQQLASSTSPGVQAYARANQLDQSRNKYLESWNIHTTDTQIQSIPHGWVLCHSNAYILQLLSTYPYSLSMKLCTKTHQKTSLVSSQQWGLGLGTQLFILHRWNKALGMLQCPTNQTDFKQIEKHLSIVQTLVFQTWQAF